MEEPRQDTEKVDRGITLGGDHLELIVVQEWIIKQLEKRTHFDHECFIFLNDIKEQLDDRDYKPAKTICMNRIECNDELTKVIAGDPDTLKRLFHFKGVCS